MHPQLYDGKLLEELRDIFLQAHNADTEGNPLSESEKLSNGIQAVATACTSQWVSVLYSKLPPESTQEEDRHKEWFMILDEDDAIFKCHRQGEDYYDVDGFRRFPTHWMPIPPSPQAGGDNE